MKFYAAVYEILSDAPGISSIISRIAGREGGTRFWSGNIKGVIVKGQRGTTFEIGSDFSIGARELDGSFYCFQCVFIKGMLVPRLTGNEKNEESGRLKLYAKNNESNNGDDRGSHGSTRVSGVPWTSNSENRLQPLEC